MQTINNKFCHWLAHKLPRRVKLYVGVYILAETTSGRYSKTIVPDLPMLEALKRFQDES